jgi:hypothetical protein
MKMLILLSQLGTKTRMGASLMSKIFPGVIPRSRLQGKGKGEEGRTDGKTPLVFSNTLSLMFLEMSLGILWRYE